MPRIWGAPSCPSSRSSASRVALLDIAAASPGVNRIEENLANITEVVAELAARFLEIIRIERAASLAQPVRQEVHKPFVDHIRKIVRLFFQRLSRIGSVYEFCRFFPVRFTDRPPGERTCAERGGCHLMCRRG